MPGQPAGDLEFPPEFLTNYLNVQVYAEDSTRPIQLKIGLIGCFKTVLTTTSVTTYTTTTVTTPVESMSLLWYAMCYDSST